MIYNRTQADVDEAKRIREEKVKAFLPLTDAEVETLERGTMTTNTLNRIEQKQAELKELLNSMGYWNTPVQNREWDYTRIFNAGDFQRLITGAQTLREAFFVYATTPQTPNISFAYEDVNSLERILYDLGQVVDDVKSRYRECGAFECGEETN